MQVFQKHEAIICGIDEALAVIKLGTGHYNDKKRAYKLFDNYIKQKKQVRSHYYNSKKNMLNAQRLLLEIGAELDELWEQSSGELIVKTLRDGRSISPWETVMTIYGSLSEYVHLETIYLGILTRRTKVATNVKKVVSAAGKKPVLYFPARFDHWSMQGGDGYAARIGGASSVSTDAQGEWWGSSGAGTIPHALIAGCYGNTVEAIKLFEKNFPDTNLIALVDFHNDCVGTSIEVAKELGKRLWGVRLDTSATMVDKSVIPYMGHEKPVGVNVQLVNNVRRALDKEGFSHVKIIVSGGFDAERIHQFEKEGVPADAYGVGSAFLRGQYDFTADIIKVDGIETAKIGRKFRPNRRLRQVDL
tara:strand:+ start:730 stop:1809 length:1080 start_codon:yes stop_codon:yes gene_type:complete